MHSFLRFAVLAALPCALAACGGGGANKDDLSSIPVQGPPDRFDYSAKTQPGLGTVSAEIWNRTGERSYIAVGSPAVRISSPKNEATMRAVILEIAGERICMNGTAPVIEPQLGHEVLLNERTEKWSALLRCEAASVAPAPVY